MNFIQLFNRPILKNESNHVFKVDNINHKLISTILQSHFITEGVYILEQLNLLEYSEKYLITPSFDKPFKDTVMKNWKFNYDEVEIFQLELNDLFFKPLDTNNKINLLNLKDINVFVQILIQKQNDIWKDLAINQYEEYLNGNDLYVNLKLIRIIQNKLLNTINKLANFELERSPVEEIDNKILQDGYKFECRFVLFDKKHIEYFQKQMEEQLDKIKLFNKFNLIRVKDKRKVMKHIKERSFQTDLHEQILCKNELLALFGDEEIIQPITQRIITPKQTNIFPEQLSFLPKGERVNEQIKQDILGQIQYAFKRVKITNKNLKILDVFQGTTLIKVQIEIPQDINYSIIQNNLKNIQAAFGNENISIEIGDKPDTFNIYLPREKRNIIYLSDILNSSEFQEYVNNTELPFILGENTNGELLFCCLTSIVHLLVAGATGSGKSVFLNNLLLSLLLSVPPEKLNIVIIDPKKVEFVNYKGFPQVSKIITNTEEAIDLVQSLCDEMEKRYSTLAKAKVKNIKHYNEINNDALPYIVCIIDEYADLVTINKNIEEYIVRLGQKARAAGIHIVLATQKPLSTIVTSVLKSNLPSAISFRLKTSSDYQTVFGKGIPYTLLGKGDGVARLEGQYKEFERFQTPVLTLDSKEEDKIFTKLKEMFKNIPQQQEIKTITEEPIDKLKRIIATTGETRISELQKHMQIRINVVADLVKQLVEEGWLEKKGRSYEIIASEEELNKFRESAV